MDIAGCLGCDLVAGRRKVPGGIVHATRWWVVNHVVGAMNLGTADTGLRFADRELRLGAVVAAVGFALAGLALGLGA